MNGIVNGELASDALLAAVGAALAWMQRDARPAVALGLAFVATAALLGVLRFGGVDAVAGAHRFASGLAATAGFPLIAFGMRWPDDPLARRRDGAARLALLLVTLGVGLPHVGLKVWSTLMPAVAALVLLHAAIRPPSPRRLAGVALLLGGFALSAAVTGNPTLAAGLSKITLLHLLLAAGLVLLCAPSRP